MTDSARALWVTLAVACAISFTPTSAAQQGDSLLIQILEIGQSTASDGELRILQGDELQSAARILEEEIATEGIPALVRRLDFDSFLLRVTADRSLGALGVFALRHELKPEAVFAEIDAGAPGLGHYSFRQMVTTDDEQRARFRLVEGEGALNYHDVLLGARGSGDFSVIDFRPMAIGIDMSSVLGIVFEHMLGGANLDPGALGLALGANDREPDPVREFLEAYFVSDYRRALESFSHQALTDENRPVILGFRLAAAYQIDDVTVIEAARDIVEAFPESPGAQLSMLDAFFFAGEYEEALHALDLLQEKVGKDGALDMYRSLYLLAAEEYGRAAEAARRATERDPDVYPIVAHDFDLSLDMGNYERVVDLMDHMESVFDFEFDPMFIEATPEFSGLILSQAYHEWRAARERDGGVESP